MIPRAKWTGRAHPLFAEAGEILGIETDLVMAAMEAGGRVYVLYTPTRENAALGEEVLGVTMVRGDGGVLRKETEPMRQTDLEGALQRLVAEIEADD